MAVKTERDTGAPYWHHTGISQRAQERLGNHSTSYKVCLVVKTKMEDSVEIGVGKCVECDTFSPCCSDVVGWSTGRASGRWKAECWFADGEDWTGALHVLYHVSQITTEHRALDHIVDKR